MAKGVDFVEMNTVFRAPKGAEDSIYDLRTHVDHFGVVTSCWELSPAEVVEVMRTRRVWLQVMTNPQQPSLPPTLVLGHTPVFKPFDSPK